MHYDYRNIKNIFINKIWVRNLDLTRLVNSSFKTRTRKERVFIFWNFGFSFNSTSKFVGIFIILGFDYESSWVNPCKCGMVNKKGCYWIWKNGMCRRKWRLIKVKFFRWRSRYWTHQAVDIETVRKILMTRVKNKFPKNSKSNFLQNYLQ